MSQAFAIIHGKGKVEAFSAGSRPSGKINPGAIESMREINYDLSRHESRSVEDYRGRSFDYVITMGCGDECPFIPARVRIDWQIPDPKNMEPADFRKIRDLIESKVKELLETLSAEDPTK